MSEKDKMMDSIACVNLQMLRASHSVLKSYDDAYRPFGVKATQLPVLNLLSQIGTATTKEIALQTMTERSVLSRKLQVMHKNEWIIPQYIRNTREKAYTLTEKGQELVNETMPIRLDVQQKIMSKLSEEERNLLINLCDKLQESLPA